MRQNRTQLVGEKMKQDGGVRQRLEMSSLDAKATPFGRYDAELIEAIQSRWYDLLDQVSYNNYRSGRVVVQFRLNYDGRITDMRIGETTVGILVQFKQTVNLFDIIGLEIELSEKLGVKVDLITDKSIHPEIKKYIDKDIQFILND